MKRKSRRRALSSAAKSGMKSPIGELHDGWSRGRPDEVQQRRMTQHQLAGYSQLVSWVVTINVCLCEPCCARC